MRVQKILLVAWLGLTCIGIAAAQSQAQAKHAHIELLAAAEPAGSILLGVHFRLEPGWHIYWTNPGDSGQPPSFHWMLPAGAAAGEVQWPRPDRLQTSPTIIDYGYNRDVLLMVPVRFAASQKSSRLSVAVEAKWLICREVCLPDHAHLSLSLAAARPENSRTARLFAKARALLPRPWPAKWKITAESRRNDFLVTIVTGRPLVRTEFFPLDPGQVDNAARQRLTTTPHGAKLVLQKSDLLLKPVTELRGVLVVGNKAYQFHTPVLASRSALK